VNKQLSKIDRAAVVAKVSTGGAMSLAEASIYYDIAYSVFRSWAKRSGLPLVGGKLFDADFKEWRQRLTGLARKSKASAPSPAQGPAPSPSKAATRAAPRNAANPRC
jgi:hypothetical protein